MNADEFNARYPVGTPVLAYPGIRPEHPVAVAFQKRANDGRSFGDKDPCKRLVTRTRTPAWPLGHGEPVVSVDGYPGGIVLEHVDVISEEQFAKARAEETAAAVAAEGALPVPVGDQPAAACRCNEPDADPYSCEADPEDCTGEFSELNPFGGGAGPVEGHDAKVSRTCGCGWRTSVWHVDDGSAEEELHGHVARVHGDTTPTAEEA